MIKHLALLIHIFNGLLGQESNDNQSSSKRMSHTITLEWLAHNCYIDTSSSAYDFFDNDFSSGNQKDSSQYCEVCKRCKLNYRKVYCYTDKGKDRQRITICIGCLRRYEEKRYELFGKPSGVVAITATARVEEMIMTTLRMILMEKKDEKDGDKEKQSAAMEIVHTTAEDNDNVFYDAVALTYDHSPVVHEYFHNDRSRTRLDNKSLWPLRYQAYKDYGI
jgi:hypothetical protein